MAVGRWQKADGSKRNHINKSKSIFLKATYHKYILNFKRPSGTSRGIITEKETWFIVIEMDGEKGIGECGILRSLSADDRPDYEDRLNWTCQNIHLGKDIL